MSNSTEKKLTQAQELAINSTKKSLLVSASAGTGKTFVMVERIIRLLCEGNDIDNFLVLTFTKDATAEMKKRIELKIVEKISHLSELNADDKLILHLATQVEKLSQANISTIDSFCKRILQKYFFVIGTNSKFKVLDDKQAIMLKNQAFKTLVKDKFKSNDVAFNNIVDIYSSSRNMDGLKNIVTSYHNYLGSLKCGEDFLKSASIHYKDVVYCEKIIIENICIDALKLKVEAEKAIALMSNRSTLFEKNISMFYTLIETLDALITNHEVKNISDIISAFTTFTLSSGKNCDEDETAIREVCKTTKSTITDFFSKLLSQYADYDKLVVDTKNSAKTIEDLSEVVRHFTEIYEKIKQKKKCLDFSDLEQKALTLLENAEVIDELNDEFKFIFIDEYQDINALQDAILSKFSSGLSFKVGDSKQSIYGFRNSDVQIFMDEVKKQGDSVINLNQNFRSNSAILDFVNELFVNLMTESFGGTNYKDNGSFTFASEADNTAVNMIVNITEKTKKASAKGQVYSVKNAEKVDADVKLDILEGVVISQKILEVVSNGVYKFKDIAILARTSTLAMSIYEGLRQHNISSFVLGNKEAIKSTAVLEVISVINIIDNLKQDIELATALSSNFFGFSKSELLQIRRKKNKAPFYECLEIARTDELVGEKVEDFYKKIEHYRLLALTMGIFEALWRLICDTDFFAKLYNEVDGVRKVTEAKNFINILKNSCDDNSVKAVVNTYNSIKDDIKLSEDVSCGNFVTIMTMHKAKGLEFPVVFIAGGNKPFSKQDLKTKIYLDKELKVCSLHYDTIKRTRNNTLVSLASKYTLLSKNLQEELRLWYVALTRAKKMLYLVVTAQKPLDDDYEDVYEFLNTKSYSTSFDRPFSMFFSGDKLKNLVNLGKMSVEVNINPTTIEGTRQENQLLVLKDSFKCPTDINLLDLPQAKEFIKIKSAASKIGSTKSTEPEFLAEVADKNNDQNAKSAKTDKIEASSGDLNEALNILDKIESVAINSNKLDISSRFINEPYEQETDNDIYINSTNSMPESSTDFNAKTTDESKESYLNLAAEIGTAYHKLIENILPFSSKQEISQKLSELVDNELISSKLKPYIDVDKVFWAKNLDLYKNKLAYSEKSFILRALASEIFDTKSNQFVLVQGVVDCILLNADKASCDIVDYKITKNKNEQIIRQRYAPQMSVYKTAVEQILKLKVNNVYIICVPTKTIIKM